MNGAEQATAPLFYFITLCISWVACIKFTATFFFSAYFIKNSRLFSLLRF